MRSIPISQYADSGRTAVRVPTKQLCTLLMADSFTPLNIHTYRWQRRGFQVSALCVSAFRWLDGMQLVVIFRHVRNALVVLQSSSLFQQASLYVLD